MPSAEMQLPMGDPDSPDDGPPNPATATEEGGSGVLPSTEGSASEVGRGVGGGGVDGEGVDGGGVDIGDADGGGVKSVGADGGGVDCCSLLANAPVYGDHYDYHVDCDPLVLPDCAWRREFGDYCNRWLPLCVFGRAFMYSQVYPIRERGPSPKQPFA
jgi:hypothetical protein